MHSTPSMTDAADVGCAYTMALEHLSGTLGTDWRASDSSDGALGWRFYRRGEGCLPSQGWKIHVSAAAAQCPAFVLGLGASLAHLGVTFKLPRRIEDVVLINSGDAGIELLGKVLTLYPSDDACARAAMLALDRQWPTSAGPEVQTDLHLRPGSAVSFRYGVFKASIDTVDSTGTHAFAFLADGIAVPDHRRPGGSQSASAPLPPLPGYPPAVCPTCLNVPLTIGAASYLPLAVIGETPRASTFLAADLTTLETVVLKAARPGVAGDACGNDMRTIQSQQFDILQALQASHGVAPRPLQCRDGAWPVLVLEDVRGKTVGELSRSQRIACLPLLAQAVARLHACGIVHGDIKLDNAVARREAVVLIDFELATRIGAPMRPSGTPGHLAPEVLGRIGRADPSRDVYALAGCVIHAVMDVPPGLLTRGPPRMIGLLCNEGLHAVARTIAPWLAPEPYSRPGARAVAATLEQCVHGWGSVAPGAGRPSTRAELRWCRRASSDAALFAGTFLQARARGNCWRNTHFMRPFDCEAVNLGAAGIMLGLRSIDCALGRIDHDAALHKAARWLSARPAHGKAAGAMSGNAGVALALAMAGRHLAEPMYLDAARRRFEAALEDRREIDIFSGVAGVVWAAQLLGAMLGQAWPLEAARANVDFLAKHKSVVAGVPVWAIAPDDDVTHFGCAHGSAGISMALAAWGRACAEPQLVDEARDTFRCLAVHARTADGAALRVGPMEHRHHAGGNWCHGVAGTLWAVLNALGDDPLLRKEIDWFVDVFSDTMAVGTPTCCHGLAGQLELWHLLERIPRFASMAQARAGKAVRALRLLHVKIDGRCTWPSDDPEIVTPDLWVGFLGPASTLAMHAAGVREALLSPAWLAVCARTAAQTQEQAARETGGSPHGH